MHQSRRAALLAVAVLIALPAVAAAHGGVWRGPPNPRTVPDGIPTPPGAVPTPPVPPGTPTPAARPLDVPRDGQGNPGFPGIPSPSATPRGFAPPVNPGPGPNHWVYWWLQNRERLLEFRRLEEERRRQRTPTATPHFLGESGPRDGEREEGPPPEERLIQALLSAARDPDADVSTGAILALAKCGDARAVPVLRALAEDASADETVRESAVLGLGMLGRPDAGLRAYLARTAADASVRTRTRCFAALALGFLGDAAALPDLVRLWRTKEASPEVPACSLVGLGLLGDEMIVPDLSRALSDPGGRRERDDLLRAYTAAALAMMRSRAGLPAAVLALRDDDEQVRRQAALTVGALARAEDESAVRSLAFLLITDPDHLVRAYAAVALGEIASPLCADALHYGYQKAPTEVAPYTVLALGLLTGRSGNPEVRERVLPFLRKAFREAGGVEMRSALALALGMGRDTESVPVLLAEFGSGGDPDYRGHCAVALGLIGDDRALAALRKEIASGHDPNVKREVALALALLGDHSSVDPLLAVLKGDASEFVRGSVATALGRLATAEQAVALADFLADRRHPDTTRAFVAVALGMVLERHPVPLLTRIGEHLNHRMAVPSLTEVLTFL